ncbi:MAG TPA: hypothetical protein VL463_03050 [Kofleriaceae bacterium]|jgi:hypothetical protein|nr:hypothetical protein [Kofleriaceae bacterium]
MTTFRSIALTFLVVAGCGSIPPRTEVSQPSAPVFAASSSMARASAPAVADVDKPAPAPAPITPPGNMTGGKEHAMANCPTAVAGAHTQMTFTDDGIELAITASTPAARAEIQKRAHLHASLAAPSGKGMHSGRHGGPGRIGYCPIVHDDRVIVTVSDTTRGARIRMRADGDNAITELQELVALRVSGLPPVMPPDLPATTPAGR